MFLKTIKVKNYRCLKEVDIDFEETTVFIGENNSGKTACLDLIRNILSRISPNAYFDEYDYFAESANSNPQESEGIAVTFIFREINEGEWNSDLISKFQPVIQPFRDDDKDEDLWQITFRVTSKYNIASEQFELQYAFLNNQNEPLPLKVQGLISDFLKLNPVFYLQALRNSEDVFSGKSFMWGKFLKQAKFNPYDLLKLQENIETLNENIISSDETLSELVSSMNDIQKVLDFNSEGSVAINALPLKSWDLLSKAQITLENKENLSFPLSRYGQGTQSMAVILLYEAYINILLKKTYNKYSQAILTLEEPEAHLHPQAIRAFEKQLDKIKAQKIITTHSPFFVQNANVYNLRIFKKKNGKTNVLFIPRRAFFEMNDVPEIIEKIADEYKETLEIKKGNLIAKRSIDDKVEKCLSGYYMKHCPDKLDELKEFLTCSYSLFSDEEVMQINSFVQKNRGEIFFARGWIMAEGQTESVLLPYFAKVLGCDLDENGISYIDYRSNGSAKVFTKLARVFDFEWTLLADNDLQGEQSVSEIENNGFSSDEITDRVRKTNGVDIEHQLINSGFLDDYEKILIDEITPELKLLKDNNIDEYKERIVDIVQKGKVTYAYRLVKKLEERNMPATEIPLEIKYIIERVCGRIG